MVALSSHDGERSLLGFWVMRGGGLTTLGEFRRRFLSRRVWAHSSAKADYAYYIVNSILHPVIVAPLILSGAAVGARVEGGLTALFGPVGAPLLGVTAARVLYTVLFFIAYDFTRFVAHGLLHDVPVLWQFHKVHHSAEVLTPLTNYRAHPVELFLMAALPNLATELVSGVVWYLAADEIGVYMFLGAHVFLALFNTIANLRHFQVWIPSVRAEPLAHQPRAPSNSSQLRSPPFGQKSRLRACYLGSALRHSFCAWVGGGTASRPRRWQRWRLAQRRADVWLALPLCVRPLRFRAGSGAARPRGRGAGFENPPSQRHRIIDQDA